MQAIKMGFGLAVAVAAIGCGGSTDAGLQASTGGSTSGGAAGASAGGSGGAAGSASGGAAGSVTGGAGGQSGSGASGGSAGSTPKYTLDDVCQKTAPQGCALSKGCCEQSGFGYDEAGCEKRALEGCQKDVAEVKAGTMTFDPAPIDACIEKLSKLLNQCVVPVGDFFAALDDLAPCNQIWHGSLPVGASCDRDAQCTQSSDPNVFTSCDKDTKKCASAVRLLADQPCQVGSNVQSFCASGLYCDAALVGLEPYNGVCKTATAVGQKCNTFKPFDLECGSGYYCNGSTGVCTQSKVGGASCKDLLECQSFSCIAGKCAPQEPLVDQQTCTG